MHKVFDGQNAAGSVDVPVGICQADKVLVVHVEGGLSTDTLTPEVSLDGTNWFTLEGTDLTDGTSSTSIAADGVYRYDVAGFKNGQVRLTKTGTADTVDAWTQVGPTL